MRYKKFRFAMPSKCKINFNCKFRLDAAYSREPKQKIFISSTI